MDYISIPPSRWDHARGLLARKPTQSVDKSLTVLSCFEGGRHSLTLGQLVLRSGFPKSTVYRIVRDLTREGYLVHASEGFRLGWRIIALAQNHVHLRWDGLAPAATPWVDQLSRRTKGYAFFGVSNGIQQSYVLTRAAHGVPDYPRRGEVYERTAENATCVVISARNRALGLDFPHPPTPPFDGRIETMGNAFVFSGGEGRPDRPWVVARCYEFSGHPLAALGLILNTADRRDLRPELHALAESLDGIAKDYADLRGIREEDDES